jgi:ribonuclease P protein component
MSHPPGQLRRTFTRADRISGRSAFARVFAARCSASDGRLVVYVFANDAARPRLGLSVGRRVDGAVGRNRIKRLLREAFRLNRHRLPEGLDVVVVVKPDPPTTLNALTDRLIRLANQAAERYARRGRGSE